LQTEKLEDAIRNAFSLISIRHRIEKDRPKKLEREREMKMETGLTQAKPLLYIKQQELVALLVAKREELQNSATK
jgi:hypothetical protein